MINKDPSPKIFRIPPFSSGEFGDETIYSDRIWQQDSKKHDELCEKHFGDQAQYWCNRDPEKIEVFLSDFFGRKIKLCQIEEMVNASTGHPYWKFDFKYVNL